MHDLNDIRSDPERYRRGLARKGGDAAVLDAVLALDGERKGRIAAVEELRARQNAASKEIAALRKGGGDASALLAEMKEVKDRERELSEGLAAIEADLEARLRLLPNLPDDRVPDGTSEADNVEVGRWGEIPEFPFEPRPHWEIGEALGGFHPEAAGAMSGSGFTLLTGPLARLERALGQFLVDRTSTVHGYREVSPPVLVRPDALDATTILAKYDAEMYRQRDDELYLIPTAETPLTNLHRGEILDAGRLPLRYTALTQCFRREAGAAGRDTRGMLRVHQFWKVEMMTFCHPDRSEEEHERMRGNAEDALRALGIPHRVVKVCSGDMSAANRFQYDLEAWAPGVGKWLEVSSVSNFGDWQARRAGTRCRSGKEKPRFVHTLNGSALGMPRTLVAILENFQREDGSVAVPEALRHRLGGLEVLAPEGGGA